MIKLKQLEKIKKKVNFLTTLPKLDCDLTDVEVDEVLCLVCDEGSEGPADDAVPCWVVGLVEFLLDESGDVLFDVEGVECLDGCVDGLVLHVV